MSIMTPEQAALRCSSAGELQELAVFQSPAHSALVEVVFARTVVTRNLIDSGAPNLIGVFGEGDSYYNVLQAIKTWQRKHYSAA